MDQGEERNDPGPDPGGFPRRPGQNSDTAAFSGAALAAALGAGLDISLPPRLEPETDVPLTMGPARPNPSPSTTSTVSEDVLEIHRLKFRYVRALDSKLWEDFAETMIPEATATYSEYLQFESREAFLTFLRNTLGPHVITEHRCDHPEIDVRGDRAEGVWYLSDTVLIPENNMLLRGAAFYTDEYVRCDDGHWRIAHTGYERTYEVVLSLSDLPSLRLTANRWGLIQQSDGVEAVERDPRETARRDETPEESIGGSNQQYPASEHRAFGPRTA